MSNPQSWTSKCFNRLKNRRLQRPHGPQKGQKLVYKVSSEVQSSEWPVSGTELSCKQPGTLLAGRPGQVDRFSYTYHLKSLSISSFPSHVLVYVDECAQVCVCESVCIRVQIHVGVRMGIWCTCEQSISLLKIILFGSFSVLYHCNL